MTIDSFEPVHFALLAGWFACERDVVMWGGADVRFPLDAAQLGLMCDDGPALRPHRLSMMAQAGGAYVGHAQLAFDWRNGNARLARVAVAPQARGRGFGVAMLSLVIERAFLFADIERLELSVYTCNTPALRTYARLGFAHEGVRRSSTRVENERWDTAIMAMLRPQWTMRVTA